MCGFYLLQVSDTRLCLRMSLASWKRFIALLSESIFSMAAKQDGEDMGTISKKYMLSVTEVMMHNETDVH